MPSSDQATASASSPGRSRLLLESAIMDERGRTASRLRWTLKSERCAHDGYLQVKTRRYLMPNDEQADWDILCGRPSVATVAVTDKDQVVLVRHYRPGPAKVLMELPGGYVSDGETVAGAARRELREETGYAARSIDVVGQTWLASYATVRRYAAIAWCCQKVGDPGGDSMEFGQPHLMTIPEFVDHARSGQMTDTDIAFLALDRMGLLK